MSSEVHTQKQSQDQVFGGHDASGGSFRENKTRLHVDLISSLIDLSTDGKFV